MATLLSLERPGELAFSTRARNYGASLTFHRSPEHPLRFTLMANRGGS